MFAASRLRPGAAHQNSDHAARPLVSCRGCIGIRRATMSLLFHHTKTHLVPSTASSSPLFLSRTITNGAVSFLI